MCWVLLLLRWCSNWKCQRWKREKTHCEWIKLNMRCYPFNRAILHIQRPEKLFMQCENWFSSMHISASEKRWHRNKNSERKKTWLYWIFCVIGWKGVKSKRNFFNVSSTSSPSKDGSTVHMVCIQWTPHDVYTWPNFFHLIWCSIVIRSNAKYVRHLIISFDWYSNGVICMIQLLCSFFPSSTGCNAFCISQVDLIRAFRSCFFFFVLFVRIINEWQKL